MPADQSDASKILARFLEKRLPLDFTQIQSSLPRISVVIPSFNQGRYLERCLISTFNQEYPNLEILVYDGGSEDNSVEIIKRHEARIAYWQSCRDGGQANALKSAFERATGDFFCWQNSDDLFFPGCLLALGHEARHSSARILCGNLFLCDMNERIFDEIKYSPIRRQDIPFVHATITNQAALFEANLYRKAGGFDSTFKYCLDLDLWARMLDIEHSSKVVPNAVGVYRCHEESKTSLMAETHAREREYISSKVLGEVSQFGKARQKIESRLRKAVHHIRAGDTKYLFEKLKVSAGLAPQRHWT